MRCSLSHYGLAFFEGFFTDCLENIHKEITIWNRINSDRETAAQKLQEHCDQRERKEKGARRDKEDEMAEYKFGDGIKTLILAGVGAVAMTAEKGQEVIGELVKKGEITVEQGKDLNKDLQRSFKETMDKRGINVDEITQKISKMSTDELAKIKEQLAAAEKIVTERMKKVEESAEEAAEEIKEAVEEVIDKAEEPAEEAAPEEAPAEEAPAEEAPAEEEEKPAEE